MPEFALYDQLGNVIADGGTYDFGPTPFGEAVTRTFTIENRDEFSEVILQGNVSATADLEIGAAEFAATASFLLYQATSALVFGPATSSAAGTFVAPTFYGTTKTDESPEGLVLSPVTFTAAAFTTTVNLFIATAALTKTRCLFDATATSARPTFSGSAALTVGRKTLAATVTFSKPTFTATVALTHGTKSCRAFAFFTPTGHAATYVGNAQLTIGHATIAAASVPAGQGQLTIAQQSTPTAQVVLNYAGRIGVATVPVIGLTTAQEWTVLPSNQAQLNAREAAYKASIASLLSGYSGLVYIRGETNDVLADELDGTITLGPNGLDTYQKWTFQVNANATLILQSFPARRTTETYGAWLANQNAVLPHLQPRVFDGLSLPEMHAGPDCFIINANYDEDLAPDNSVEEVRIDEMSDWCVVHEVKAHAFLGTAVLGPTPDVAASVAISAARSAFVDAHARMFYVHPQSPPSNPTTGQLEIFTQYAIDSDYAAAWPTAASSNVSLVFHNFQNGNAGMVFLLDPGGPYYIINETNIDGARGIDAEFGGITKLVVKNYTCDVAEYGIGMWQTGAQEVWLDNFHATVGGGIDTYGWRGIAQKVRFRNSSFTNTGGKAILRLHGCTDGVIEDCVFYGGHMLLGGGPTIQDQNVIGMSNVIFNRCTFTKTNTLTFMEHYGLNHHIIFRDCDFFTPAGTVGTVLATIHGGAHDIMFFNCTLDGNPVQYSDTNVTASNTANIVIVEGGRSGAVLSYGIADKGSPPSQIVWDQAGMLGVGSYPQLGVHGEDQWTNLPTSQPALDAREAQYKASLSYSIGHGPSPGVVQLSAFDGMCWNETDTNCALRNAFGLSSGSAGCVVDTVAKGLADLDKYRLWTYEVNQNLRVILHGFPHQRFATDAGTPWFAGGFAAWEAAMDVVLAHVVERTVEGVLLPAMPVGPSFYMHHMNGSQGVQTQMNAECVEMRQYCEDNGLEAHMWLGTGTGTGFSVSIISLGASDSTLQQYTDRSLLVGNNGRVFYKHNLTSAQSQLNKFNASAVHAGYI